MLDLVNFVTEADFDNIVKIASELDLNALKDLVQEAQFDISASNPAWSSWA